MTLKTSYFDLMDHLGPTQPVCAMPPDAPMQDLISLRHDIDHSLDVALEMAFWEHDRGLKATYYLLNSTDYWNDPDFDTKVRQLLEFGHEVGVHVNSLANWLAGRCATPAADLNEALERLRKLGANATSTAAHGDKLCYQHEAANFWMFSEELSPDKTREPISAEGIAVSDPSFQIKRPEQRLLTRADGKIFELGSLELQDFALSFLGHRAGWDRYFSDSGGGWTRTSDPLDVPDIGKGRSMVLVHPIHWCAPPRQIYILSPARSGSTWLARVADQASSATGVHEQTFNHRDVEGAFTPLKRTHYKIDSLYKNRDEQLNLIRDRRAWFDRQKSDVLECNVYLAPALDALKQINPDATFGALLRDPRDILVSLLNRDWYDTADDDKHPVIATPGWAQLDQVEKAAHYIADTRARILSEPGIQLVDLAVLNDTPDELRAFFVSLGLAFYPCLAEPLRGQKVNANKIRDLADFAALPERDQLRALEIIYADGSEQNIYPSKSSATPLSNPRAWYKKKHMNPVSRHRLSSFPTMQNALELRRSSRLLECVWRGTGLWRAGHIDVPAGFNGAIMIGERLYTSNTFSLEFNQARALKRNMRAPQDIPALTQGLKVSAHDFDFTHHPERHYRLSIKTLKSDGLWQLMVQTFDSKGEPALLKRLIPQLAGPHVEMSFNLPVSAYSMRLVLYAPKVDHSRHLSFDEISLETSETVLEDTPLDPALAKSRILVLTQANWTADHGSPRAAKALAQAGFGTVIWATCEGMDNLKEDPFMYSEGVNFTKLCYDDSLSGLRTAIDQIKQMRPDMVIDLGGVTNAPFQSACAAGNINLIHASEASLIDELKAGIKGKGP